MAFSSEAVGRVSLPYDACADRCLAAQPQRCCGMQVEKGKEMLQELMSQQSFFDVGPAPWGTLFGSVMGDRSKVEDGSALPQTGMPAAVEQELSSIFVEPCNLGVSASCSLSAQYRTQPHQVSANI